MAASRPWWLATSPPHIGLRLRPPLPTLRLRSVACSATILPASPRPAGRALCSPNSPAPVSARPYTRRCGQRRLNCHDDHHHFPQPVLRDIAQYPGASAAQRLGAACRRIPQKPSDQRALVEVEMTSTRKHKNACHRGRSRFCPPTKANTTLGYSAVAPPATPWKRWRPPWSIRRLTSTRIRSKPPCLPAKTLFPVASSWLMKSGLAKPSRPAWSLRSAGRNVGAAS